MKHALWIAALGAAMLAGCGKEHGSVAALQAAGNRAGNRHFTHTTPVAQRRLAALSTPMYFEPNVGQTDAQVRFLSRGAGYSVFLTRSGPVFSLAANPHAPVACRKGRACSQPASPADVVRIAFAGANPDPVAEGVDPQPGKSHYLIGKDRNRWHPNVARFSKVRYRKVYPGIDAVFYGNQKRLEYDFVVAPGADPRQIALDMDGVRSMRIDPAGNLVLSTDGGELLQHKPVVYQQIANRRIAVEGRYVLHSDRQAGFALGKYDTRAPLVIDPMFGFSAYFGGTADDRASSVATDAVGNTYVTGWTTFDLPTNAYPKPRSTAFVAKFDADGVPVFTTYLGGTNANAESSGDSGASIAVDAGGHAYVAGLACSTDFPVVNAVQPQLGGHCDAFVAKLASDGSALDYSTYVGGSEDDASAYDDIDSFAGPGSVHIAVDGSGSAYLAGRTTSYDFPVHNAIQPQPGDYNYEGDAYVVKLSPAGDAFIYSTYLGGWGSDGARGIAVDASGNAYITGGTTSADFPTVAAWQPNFAGMSGWGDAFVTEINADGSALVYSSYLGGTGGEGASAIAVDADGNAYVTGTTNSSDFPFSAAPVGCPGADAPLYTSRGFVAKFAPAGAGAVYSTCLKSAYPTAIAVDGAGNAYLAGWTDALDFPTVVPMQAQLDTDGSTPRDAFVSKLSPDGTTLLYSTYLGGNERDAGTGVAVDGGGTLHVVGNTAATDFPTTDGSTAPEDPSAMPGSINNAFVLTIKDGVGVSIKDVSVAEGSDTHTVDFTIRLSSPSDAEVGFDVDTIGDTATEGEDYQGVHEHVVLQPGETEKTVSVTVIGDALPEQDETFGVTLSNATGAVVTAGTAVGTLGNDDTLISVDDGSAVEGTGEGTGAHVTVRLSAPVVIPVSFDVNFIDGTATAADRDFDAYPRQATIPAGSTSIDVPVAVNADDVIEPDEALTVTIGNVEGATPGDASAAFTILNDDTALTVHDASVSEGDSGTVMADVTVSLSVPSAAPVTFLAMASDGSAKAGSDYDALSFVPMTIPPGSTSAVISVPVHGDTTMEANETVQVWIQAPEGASIADSIGNLTILNDDTTLSIADTSVVEGNSGSKMANFTVSLAQPSVVPVTFDVATTDGTAAAGSDYTATSLTGATIPPGSTSTQVSVPINGDTAIEGNETFKLVISNVAGAAVTDGTAVGTIRNDDTKLSIADVSVIEGNSGSKLATFTVKLSNTSARAVTFNVATANKTAAAGTDYVATSLTGQSIAAGATSKTFTVSILGDRAVEANETLLVNVSQVVGAVVSDGQAVGTIRNDDAILSIADVSTTEGNSGTKVATFTVKLSAVSAAPVAFNISTANKTAIAGSDYVASILTGQAIAAGTTSKTFAVTLKGDTLREANETFLVNVGSVVGATVGDAQAMGTIVNDD